MGGLLIRSYIKKYSWDKLDTVIYLGTPHQGSPKSYAVLRWAYKYFDFINRYTLSLVSQNCPSSYELLPRTEFILDDDSLEDINTSFQYLSNQAHVNTANAFHRNIQGPSPVQRTYAINGSGQSTLQYFKKNNKGDIEVFPDIRGDGTVTSASGSGLENMRVFYVQGEHSALPGLISVQEKIKKILDRKENESVDGIQDVAFEAPELMRWSSLSPITVHFTDIHGNTTGRSEEDDIKEDIPQSQFYVFPNNESGFLPRDGVYRVDIKALDTGFFTLLFETANRNGDITSSLVYKDIPISSKGRGELLFSPDNPSLDLLLDVDGDSEADYDIQPGGTVPDELNNMFTENGDVNKDKNLDISDAVAILGYLFLGTKIACVNACDANGDSEADVSDPIYLLGYLFLGTAEKPKGLIFCQ